jgi:hypothetical protein
LAREEVLNQLSVYCRTERMQAIAQKIMYSGPCFCNAVSYPIVFLDLLHLPNLVAKDKGPA